MREKATGRMVLGAGAVEYRWEPRGGPVVLVFHGGHLRAGLPLGEEVYREAGCSLLVPSRPGYGATPVTTAPAPGAFADAAAELCARLGVRRVAACVGVSAGGPTALAMAARHPELVERLVLESAVGPLPWPGRRTAAVGRLLFGPRVEALTWGTVRLLVHGAPGVALRVLLRDLTTGTAARALAGLGPQGRAEATALMAAMRSGAGFANDLTWLRAGAGPGRPVAVPTLVVASPRDGSVPFGHAEALVAAIPGAELLVSGAACHFVWWGADRPRVAERITAFLAGPPGA
ncbi:alpha/beta hydrolase [Streptomyces sp. NPDC047970]|uniref:alpha/beta fold hydrolase n=2 Tax=Streptomyces TaxID=1883 RepID=UPI0034257868